MAETSSKSAILLTLCLISVLVLLLYCLFRRIGFSRLWAKLTGNDRYFDEYRSIISKYHIFTDDQPVEDMKNGVNNVFKQESRAVSNESLKSANDKLDQARSASQNAKKAQRGEETNQILISPAKSQNVEPVRYDNRVDVIDESDSKCQKIAKISLTSERTVNTAKHQHKYAAATQLESLNSSYEQLFERKVSTPISESGVIASDSASDFDQMAAGEISGSIRQCVVDNREISRPNFFSNPTWTKFSESLEKRQQSGKQSAATHLNAPEQWTDFRYTVKSPVIGATSLKPADQARRPSMPEFQYVVTQPLTVPVLLNTHDSPKIENNVIRKADQRPQPKVDSRTIAPPKSAPCSPGRSKGAHGSVSEGFLPLTWNFKRNQDSARRSSFSSTESSIDEPINRPIMRAVSTESVDSSLSVSEEHSYDKEVGQLELRFLYDCASQFLFVWVLQAFDLKCKLGPDAEIWVVLFLLPFPKPLWRTQLKKCVHSVTFQEKFYQCVREPDLGRLALLCQLHGRRSTSSLHDLLGQSKVRLKDIELMRVNTLWMTLLPASQMKHVDNNKRTNEQLGEILFSLNYQPTAERLTVVIAKIRGLQMAPLNGFIPKAITVRVYMVQGARVFRKKTSPRSLTDGSIMFNESMIFSLPQTQITKVALRLSVQAVNKKSDDQMTIGQVTVGPRRSGKEFGHWQKMLEQPRKPANMWHCLVRKTA